MRLAIPVSALAVLSFALGWAVLFKGGVWPDEWAVSLAAIGLASCFFWLFRGSALERLPVDRPLSWLLIALPLYVALTLIPLPARLLDVLSPARATLLRQLQPVVPGLHLAPLSVNPPATLLLLATMIAYVAVFLLLREIVFSLRRWPWAATLPLILFASLEAGLGLLQGFAGSGHAVATGTYTNRDHFAGLLEMVLPFAILYGFTLFEKQRQGSSVVRACGLWCVSALIFAAILYSLSRMGFIVALFVLFLAAVFAFGAHRARRKAHWTVAAGVSAALVLGVALFSPDQLAGRFAVLSSNEAPSTEIRAALWRETLPLISDFKFFGCGLGGFESAFLKHQAAANAYTVEFAHNDYLQYFAELGLIGFLLLAAIIGLVARDLVRALWSMRPLEHRLLAAACAASLAGMALHSFLDFNTYIPANAMTLAWIAGIGSASARD